jgi:DNA-binding MarR family transcriptional regulator
MAIDSRSSGILLSELVNRVSHGSGETLRVMADAEVTLQQVLLLSRLRQTSPSSASDLAGRLNLSLPAVSQAVDRLVRLKLVTRMEDLADRRKKKIATTSKANALLVRLTDARAREYSAGLSILSDGTLKRLEHALKEVLHQLS